MNRVLLCGVCIGAVRSLLGEECGRVTVITASDGSVKTRVELDACQNAQATIIRDGIRYCAKAEWTEEAGITLADDEVNELTKKSPGLVTLLMQNLARYVQYEGVAVTFWIE